MTVHKSQQRHTHVKQLLGKMDPEVAASFTYKQRKALDKVINTRGWNNHKIDFRPTLAFPFLPWSFYIVFLGGVNKRSLNSTERFTAAMVFVTALTIVGMMVLGLVFVILYLIKSWLGIDLFPNESLGVWDQFKDLFK
ncbi:hypothetical protein [Pseudoalteromonas luteoviolacea]|uniref:3-phosphoshikimate 1-carboxyvinyltransferase n=1 Tax=Pseudoalteromonas luteoviolacea S4054 TaxID=1129367 RepID=A0A0F6A3T7_9GAMM|nr:hypothetical protein [Pseudoalteromonas luteoviolacea]AOT08930.1 hypothetical protein S4054249_14145 [Pseudoalteromonas luteoviolacea]AOT13842.1 hypothetical protein S40542_14115 [Pseudoalteromonas luteoviolacea]AOT18757.1 hypothetical protein S4054_14120 [Pseudoalteromonas luteoviolacea]KKE80870.1 hypothetical protein N479_04120 [Pseudoalteromonas luteoviolacea S4054]KZN70996.1 hypothetical protein N481_20015 [Pseudoalteromonas luteoviolacea S4047-1]